ncbi:MAG: hypothetical protein M1824_002519 [Vezdaea acicularis]|nr:MAG: hypothetical protein M1824_002519 [Vezdaea acicularis]
MAKLTIKSSFRLNSGFEIPLLGYGTGGPLEAVYQTPANVTESVVSHAFKTGYRHVDSAVVYRNEAPCGVAIHKSKIPRADIFFTSKIPPGSMNYATAVATINETLERTGLEYVDLYLIHAPYGGRKARLEVWQALVEAQQAGKIRSLGVSNYGVHHLNELETYIEEIEREKGKGMGGVLSVGQWEVHPWLQRKDIVEWCKKRGVVVEAYCPIVRGQRLGEPSLKALAKKHEKTPAQILIRWSLQKGYVPLPKSVTPSRIEENADVYDFDLSTDDIASLDTDEYSPCSWDPTVDKD